MKTERFNQIDGILQSALDLPRKLRPAYLDAACDGDETLRKMVAELIEAAEREGGFLDEPIIVKNPDIVAEALGVPKDEDEDDPFASLKPGVEIAHQFAIVRELGRGAFGIVFLCKSREGK